MYDAAAKDPEAFWRAEAGRIAWMKAPTKIK
ncbi:MAG: acetyl-coenzyme A synthetase N-terminal domain-containing protein, partial [Alphaproteobacteria bacterium]